MDYKTMLSKLTLTDLKQIIRQYMGHVKITVSKKSKEELIDHIMKHTEFKNNKITIKSHDDLDIDMPKKESKKEPKKEEPKPKPKKEKMVESKAPKVQQYVESKPPKLAETEVKKTEVKKTKEEKKKEEEELIMKMAERSANKIKVLLEEFNKDLLNKTKRKAVARAFDNASSSTRAVLRKDKDLFEKLQKISNDVKIDLEAKQSK